MVPTIECPKQARTINLRGGLLGAETFGRLWHDERPLIESITLATKVRTELGPHCRYSIFVRNNNMLLDRLRRVTRDGQWIPEIDGLRFVAILAVLLFHMFGELSVRTGRNITVEVNYWWMERLLINGARGVRLFFVISGMILALPFAQHLLLGSKPVSLRKYYMRRVTRLEVPYIVSMILAVLFITVYSHGFPAGSGPHVLASIFYQHNLVYGSISSVNPVAWSLEVEIQFYVLAPLIMQFYRIPNTPLRRGFLLLCVLLISLAQAPFQGSPRFELSILFYLQYFLMGLLVGDVLVLNNEMMRPSWIWDIVGIAALGAIFWPTGATFWTHALMPIPIGILCVAAIRSHFLRKTLGNKWVAVIGGMCYSIYLLHFLLIAVLFKVTRHAIFPGAIFLVNYALQLLLTMVPAVAMCTIFFLLVERPCMNPTWPTKLWHALTGRREIEVAVLDTTGISE
jgi:peptidoglycan/LPS O-acetylase OafA/YrhL